VDEQECERKGGTWIGGNCYGGRIDTRRLLFISSIIAIIIATIFFISVSYMYFNQDSDERLGDFLDPGEEQTTVFEDVTLSMGLDSEWMMILLIVMLIVSVVLFIVPLPGMRIFGAMLFIISFTLLIIQYLAGYGWS